MATPAILMLSELRTLQNGEYENIPSSHSILHGLQFMGIGKCDICTYVIRRREKFPLSNIMKGKMVLKQ